PRPVHLSTIQGMLVSVPPSPSNETAVNTCKSVCSRVAALQPSPYRDQSDVSCFSNSASSRFQSRSPAASTSSWDGDGQYFLKISSMLIFFRHFILYLLQSTSISSAPAAPS